MTHIPVLCEEAISFLNVKPSGIYVDATLGDGGHSKKILEKLQKGALIGVDADPEALIRAEENLKGYSGGLFLRQGNFAVIDAILGGLHLKKIDGIIFDLGVSSGQLDNARRGFSFRREGPLNMRMDTKSILTAEEVINTYPREELERILKNYGEEPGYRRIADAIVNYRSGKRITTTAELAKIAARFARAKAGIDPATRTFQALRIEVNNELKSLSDALEKLPGLLNKQGRLVVISYHSLEDRIVKHFLKNNSEVFSILTKKPIVPSDDEISANPRSRSAKLRAAEHK